MSVTFRLVPYANGEIVALETCGTEVGRASVSPTLHGLPTKEGELFLHLAVKPEHRRQGVGTALIQAALAQAKKQGAYFVSCCVDANDEESLAFARKRGFRFDYQMVEGELDVRAADLNQWEGAVAAAEAHGIRFTTLLQAQDEPDILKKLYELDRELSADVPQWSGVMPPFEEYCASLRDEHDPEGTIVAWEGDSPVGYTMTTPDGYTSFMGVSRQKRGLGIALALKVLTISWAKGRGIQRLHTHNNNATEPILSLNRKLGYTLKPGTIYLTRQVRRRIKEPVMTVLTLALFVGIYAWWKDWWYGTGMGAIILAHELGHMVAGARRGVTLTTPVFIPFIGAFVSWKKQPPNAFDEAVLAAGGPVAGLAASALAWGLGAAFAVPQLEDVAYLGFAIHVFNMIPVLPFDGGRITGAVTRWVWYLFAPVFVFYCLWQDRAWLLGAMGSTLRQMLKPADDPSYYRVTSVDRWHMGLTYTGILAAAVLGVVGTSTTGGLHLPWLTAQKSSDVTLALWGTGIISAIYLVWRFGRPIWGPWFAPIDTPEPDRTTDEK